ncbi:MULTISPECIES: helix-turn-helix domain-containing protein [unclassified Streptomyces]|uniref:helix-turn-helix domain-containing protein n=1 Tax=unclassified Streptomyces TaxID=2593676 RepID=UPI000DB9A065|nr:MULTISPECIES: helix-turn-helix domain-containing protein [unclassified Streptomyces]MYT68611.1 helix-turn-helix domain-containing protein [Streptomyces sp. SID8367]RAJ86283.1 DNA-directed RNA polymerase specialized sigma24 family protein [Streptomyces sp. PsTaAH-137]
MTQSPATPLPTPTERRRLRVARSLTQTQIAERVGVTRETVRSWETGRTAPRGRKREAYARLLAELGRAETGAAGTDARPAAKTRTKADARAEKSAPAAPVAVREAPAEPSEPGDGPDRPRSATEAFDALYAHSAPHLVRQTYLLTGRRTLARESVERAFQLAWQRWPEVAVDPDPVSWVRAAAYEYAMSPWHRLRPAHRQPDAPPADADDRKLMDVLQSLPPAYRRTLLLYDGVGLDLPETAAETEASTPAAANRILHAREAVAEQLPDLAVPEQLHRRLTELAGAEKLDAPGSTLVRGAGEKRVRFWTRTAIAVTALIVGMTVLTLRVAPTHYDPTPAPGAPISGVPPLTGPGHLTEQDLALREALKKRLSGGPERLAPVAE